MRLKRCVLEVGVGLAVLALVFSMAQVAFGQSATGIITGTVTDPKGLAMTGVMVTVHDVNTGVDHVPVMTNDQGVYNVPLLQPDNYDITASQPGFSTVKRAAVQLQVGQTVRVDIEMPVSAQQTLVTVTTEIPLLETEKTETSQNVSEALVNNLPVSSRNWAQFTLLTPGVNPDGTNGGMSFHGINNLYNNIMVDGANENYNYDGGARGGTGDGYVYSSDSIREFQVASSGFNADTGQSAGGSVNTVTKSGTNQFHGDLFYSGRSNAFNALDPVNKNNAAAKGTVATANVHQQHQYGGSLGGPLWKDKLFFFTTADQYRKINPLTTTTNQLSPSIQALTCPTVDPLAVAGTTAPTANQCQAAKTFINSSFIGTYPQSLWQDVELIKLDYQLNQSNHISAVTNIRDRRNTVSPTDLNNAQSPNSFNQDRSILGTWTLVIGSNKVNELRYQYAVTNQFSSLNGNQGMPGIALSGIVTYGEAGGGSGWTKETRHQVTDNFSWTKGAHSMKFGVDLNFIQDDARSSNNSGGLYSYTGGNSMAPNIDCTAPAVTPSSGQGAANTQNLIFCNWLMDVYGKNGMENLTLAGLPSGNANRTGQHWDTFNQFFDLLFPTFPNSFHYLIPDNDYGAFAQDTWKVRPNLTVNFGLRYDLQQLPDLPNSPAKNLAALQANYPGSFDLPIFDTYTTTYPSENDSIQPRVGVAWNVAKNTVIRFSGGIFIAKTEGHNVKNAFSGAGESTTNCSATSTGLSNCPTTGTPLTFPNVYFYQQDGALWTIPLTGAVSSVALDPPSGLHIPTPTFGIRGVDPTLRRPRVYSIDAAVEQRLPGNMNLSVSYVYTKGIRLPRGRDFNIGQDTPDAQYCSNLAGGATPQTCGLTVQKTYDVVDNNGVTQTSVTIPFFASRPAIAASGTTPAAGLYNVRVDPRTGVINGNQATAYSEYNGMIVSLRKPMSHGLEVQGNYTLSLAKDSGEQGAGTNGGEGQVGIPAMNPYNNQAEWGNSATDTRHRFTTSVIWAPSFEKYVMNTAGKELLGGWSLSSSIIAQSGGHYTALTSGSTPKTLVINGCTPGQTTGTCSTPFTYSPLDGGMSGVFITSPGANSSSRLAWLPTGGFVLPNLYDVDLRLEKQFSIKERFHIAIRGEAFNLFNSSLIQAVSTSAYSYQSASPTPGTVAKPNFCPTSAIAGTQTPHASTVTCMAPVAAFQQPTTTSGNNLGARQLQAGLRFEF